MAGPLDFYLVSMNRHLLNAPQLMHVRTAPWRRSQIYRYVSAIPNKDLANSFHLSFKKKRTSRDSYATMTIRKSTNRWSSGWFDEPTTTKSAACLLVLVAAVFTKITAVQMAQQVPRPSLVNERIRLPTDFRGNGHAMSFDGRLVIKRTGDAESPRWEAQAVRPERLEYDEEGRPVFGSHKDSNNDNEGGGGVFSSPLAVPVNNGENALTFCHDDPSTLYRLDVNGSAVYEPWVVDSCMENRDHSQYRLLRRRKIRVVMEDPFTADTDIAEFDPGIELQEYLTTTKGQLIGGIEPTMTIDGQLVIYQGNPFEPTEADYMMYTYNPTPCALHGWSPPQLVHQMAADPAVQKYPMAWNVMKAADGTIFTNADPLHAAYPWVDPEGRFVLYAAVRSKPGDRGLQTEGMSLIGHKTQGTAYNIDGSINSERYGYSRAFFSSPMWHLEKERHPMLITPDATSNHKTYLPVTKQHDVLPLLGTNSGDYIDVDLDITSDPFAILNLPMNEMATIQGTYNDRQVPDLSGQFATGFLLGYSYISTDFSMSQSPLGLLNQNIPKGEFWY